MHAYLESCVSAGDAAFHLRLLDVSLTDVRVSDFLSCHCEHDINVLGELTFGELQTREIRFNGWTCSTLMNKPYLRALCFMSHMNVFWAAIDERIQIKGAVDVATELDYWSDGGGGYDKASVSEWARAAVEVATHALDPSAGRESSITTADNG